MSDKINQIRFEIRSLLSEEIQEQAIIAFEAVPGDKPEWESYINVVGFDKAMSRGTGGFGGGGTAGHETEEDVGAWKVLGLPERTATGMNSPSPWIVFMDWFWNHLKSTDMKPAPHKGFGEVTKAYSQLTPAQKRQRKYGTQHKAGTDPDLIRLPDDQGPIQMPGRQDLLRTRALHGGEHLWPAGFDIKRQVRIVTTPLGEDLDIVAGKFREIMSKAKPEPWFRIAENRELEMFFVFVNIDAEMPEGWRDRFAAAEIYHSQRKAEWQSLLRDMSENRTNIAQLKPIIARYMVDVHQFEPPFNVDVLVPEEYERAKKIISRLRLAELIEYAKKIGVVPPVVGQVARSNKETQYNKAWDDIIEKLTSQGLSDPLVVDVALSNYMSSKGFPDPFDFETLPNDKKLKAIHMANKVRYFDIEPFMEEVRNQIKAILE